MLYLENGHFHGTVRNLPTSVETHCILICMDLVLWLIGLKKMTHQRIQSVYYEKSLKWLWIESPKLNSKLIPRYSAIIVDLLRQIFDRKYQDIHTYFVCNVPKEDINHMYTYSILAAVKNQEKNLTELKKELEDLETTPIITRTIIRSLRYLHNVLLRLYIHLAMRILEEVSQSEISWKIKKI